MSLLPIGKLIKPYGLKGQIKTSWFVDDIKELKAFSRFYVVDKKQKKGYREVFFEKTFFRNGGFITKLKEVEDRTQADLLRNTEVFVEESEFPKLKTNVFYIKDVLNLPVYWKKHLFGYVVNVITIASSNLLLIKMENGRELAVPFNNRYIPKLELKEKAVYAENIEELL